MIPLSQTTHDGSDIEKGASSPGTVQLGKYSNSLSKYSSNISCKVRDRLCELKSWTQQISQRVSSLGNSSGNDDPLIVRTLESCPLGYPKLAAFIDSDDNFMIFRRFGFLYSRVLLNKQDEIRELESRLDEMDKKDYEDKSTRRCLKSRSRDEKRTDNTGQTRKELLRTSEQKLLEYGNIILQAQQLVSMNRPAARDLKSVQNFMANGSEEDGCLVRPLLQADASFIYRNEDLVTLRAGRESPWLDAFVERILKLFPCRTFRYIFCDKATRLKTNNEHIQYYSKERINRFVTLVITCMILVLLVIPVYALYKSSSGPDNNSTNIRSIGILLVATLIFSAVLSLFTRAKRHEILGASAAYCAVLVVFIGNVGGKSQD